MILFWVLIVNLKQSQGFVLKEAKVEFYFLKHATDYFITNRPTQIITVFPSITHMY